jgi:hypothetical protein
MTLGGSAVDVRSKNYQNILSIFTLERGKMGKCMLLAFILECSTFIYISSNNVFYHILCTNNVFYHIFCICIVVSYF